MRYVKKLSTCLIYQCHMEISVAIIEKAIVIISQPILHYNEQIRCIDICFEGQGSL